MRTVL